MPDCNSFAPSVTAATVGAPTPSLVALSAAIFLYPNSYSLVVCRSDQIRA
jgi:hypothetical protein